MADDALFHLQLHVLDGLVGEHVDHLLGAAQTGGVGLLGGDANGFVRRFDNDLGGLGQGGDGTAQGDNAEGLGLIGGEAAHPLVQNGGDHHVIIAVLLQVLLRELLQRLNGGYVLNEVAALSVAHGDVLDALFGGQKGLDDGHGVGDAGGHQGAGEGTVGLPVDGHAVFLIEAGETVHILPVQNGSFQGLAMVVSIGTFLQ